MAITRRHWEVNVEDQVWVSSGGRSMSLGRVVKIGPKLVHVSQHSKVTPYYLETGTRRDGYPGGFTTQAQHDSDERRSVVVKNLRETFGIEFRPGSSLDWTTENLEALLNAVAEIIHTD
jgi:hypothetical protein